MACSMFGNSTANGSDCAFNKSEEQLLEETLGGRYRIMSESVILTIVYSCIFITGVVGNVCTCIVIIKNNYMHTATNYYLFSLAISDVLTLILGLPPELYTIWEAYPWRLGEPYCLFKTFLTEMTSCASILTITAFTVERYVAICHPIRAQRMSSLSRAIKIIAVIWLAACTVSLPYPVHTRTYYYTHHPITKEPLANSLICNIPSYWMSRMQAIFQLSTFLLFILPMSVISVLYVLIGITLRHSGLARQTSNQSGSSPPQSQSRKAVLKMLGRNKPSSTSPPPHPPSSQQMIRSGKSRQKTEVVHAYLVAVVVAFFICWAPFHAQRLMTVYVRDYQWTKTLLEIQSVLFYISGVLYFVSSTVNPILYNLMSRKYRQAFKETLCRCCLTEAERHPWRDGRSRYYTERSTYTTFTASRMNQQTSSSSQKSSSASVKHHHPAVPKTTFNGNGSVKSCSNNNGGGGGGSSGCTGRNRWILWKKRLFKPRGGGKEVRGFSSPVNGTKKFPVVPSNASTAAVNGTTCSDESRSASSSPGLMAAHIKEEMEMDNMLQRNVVYPVIGDPGQGTML